MGPPHSSTQYKDTRVPRPAYAALKLRNVVASKLILDWSPQQIFGWLKIQYPDDESMRVSHETIYRSLFIQARGALKKELLEHLRSSGGPRCPGALGGRSPARLREQSHRHLGGTPVPLCHADQGS